MWEKGMLARIASQRFGAALVLGSVCLTGVATVEAQVADSTLRSAPPRRLLNKQEGRLILAAASEQSSSPQNTQDCSHVVHQIYSDAGFDYPYMSSIEAYAGSKSFARVKSPRAGDLIVWPGHMGIVADPFKHSFYSLVSTGFEEQDYDAPYWRARGRAHFYRYRVQNPVVLTATKIAASSPVSGSNKQPSVTPVREQQSSDEASSYSPQSKAASEQTALIYGPVAPPELVYGAPASEIPSSIVIVAGKKPPTREEVAVSISALNDAAGNVLRSDDPSKLPLPVVIVDKFTVERVEIKRDHGWAQLQIESRVCVGCAPGPAAPPERVRWELRHTESGWEAVTPPGRTYVSHDVAVRNLAAQLARLSESDADAAHQAAVLHQESQLANLLTALLGGN